VSKPDWERGLESTSSWPGAKTAPVGWSLEQRRLPGLFLPHFTAQQYLLTRQRQHAGAASRCRERMPRCSSKCLQVTHHISHLQSCSRAQGCNGFSDHSSRRIILVHDWILQVSEQDTCLNWKHWVAFFQELLPNPTWAQKHLQVSCCCFSSSTCSTATEGDHGTTLQLPNAETSRWRKLHFTPRTCGGEPGGEASATRPPGPVGEPPSCLPALELPTGRWLTQTTAKRRCCFSLGLMQESHLLQEPTKPEDQIAQGLALQLRGAAERLPG